MAVESAPGTEQGTASGSVADLIRNGIAVLSAGAAGIHFAVIQTHFEDYWLFGAAFAGMAWFQALWAILIVASPNRILLMLGALGNGAIVALWVVTRTTGLPIGPNSGVPEPAEFIDVLATAFEVLVVLGSLWLLARGLYTRPLGRQRILAGTLVLGLAVVGLTSGAVAEWSPHGHGGAAEEEGHAGEEPAHGEEPGHMDEAPADEHG